MLGIIKKLRRNRLRKRRFLLAWVEIIRKNVPYYQRLPSEDRRELRKHIQVFIAEKRFEGCGGLEMTDEIRVSIAAQACILLLHRKHDYYPELESILVYPSSYLVRTEEMGEGGVVIESYQERTGESWSHGTVILAWDAVRHSAADAHGGGHNVVLHEFAHQLDQQDGRLDGAPSLAEPSQYVSWARILGKEFKALQKDADADRPSLLDQYGAKDPAEFFAVATECFFENPVPLRAKHPELYEQLKEFYQQDPASMSEQDP